MLRPMAQDWKTTVGAIVAAIVLCQSPLVAGVPNYGLPNDVPGSQLVADGNNQIASYLPSFVAAQLTTATLTQTAFGLPTILDLLTQTGTYVSEAGLSGTAKLSALIAGNAGSSAALFADVLHSIDAELAQIGQQLPVTEASLKALIGNNVPDRLTDGFGRITTGLTQLRAIVVRLRDAIAAAVAEAGSELAVPAATLQRHVTLPLIYELADAVYNLRAYLPVVRYTLSSSIEDVLTADAFLSAYRTAVDAAQHQAALHIPALDAAQASFYADLTDTSTGVEGLAQNLTAVLEYTQELGLAAVPALASGVEAMLAPFSAALDDVDTDLAGLDAELQDYNAYIDQLLTITDTELVAPDRSQLIGALVHTLIDCGRYARYCFHKYQYEVADLVDALSLRTGECVEREARRLDDLGVADLSLLQLPGFDIDDIVDLLSVCDGVQSPTDQANCVSALGASFTPLGAVFADRYALLYDITSTELAASKQRVKMCVGLYGRLFDERYIPDLQADIESCAAGGPNAS